MRRASVRRERRWRGSAIEEHLPFLGGEEPAEESQEGGLAGAVGPDQGAERPLRDLEGEVAQGRTHGPG